MKGSNCTQIMIELFDIMTIDVVKYRLIIKEPSLKASSDADTIMHRVSSKSLSFINYISVRNVITKFGTERDKKRLTAYETSFKNYCKRIYI